MYAWGQGLLIEKKESSDVVCNKPVILGKGIFNIMEFSLDNNIQNNLMKRIDKSIEEENKFEGS